MFEAFQTTPMSKEHGLTMPNHLSGVSGFLDHTSGSEVQSPDHAHFVKRLLYAAYRCQTWQHPSLSSPRASRAMNIKVPVSYGTIVDEASTETVMEETYQGKVYKPSNQQLSSR